VLDEERRRLFLRDAAGRNAERQLLDLLLGNLEAHPVAQEDSLDDRGASGVYTMAQR
jgi:hypothetical protein